ncbi:hypothetical protein EV359DRAFT_69313, partial [Lentinula novae-zelandiae]
HLSKYQLPLVPPINLAILSAELVANSLYRAGNWLELGKQPMKACQQPALSAAHSLNLQHLIAWQPLAANSLHRAGNRGLPGKGIADPPVPSLVLTRAQARAALKLRILAYNLETALRQEEERWRQDAELCGEDIYDEDVELESDFELEIEAQSPIPTISRPSSETYLPAHSSPLSSSSLSASSTLLTLDTALQPRNVLTTLPPSWNEIKEQWSHLLKKKADKRRKGRAKHAETSQM